MNISFIVPTYNNSEQLKNCINSILNLDGLKEFEIIVIDDFSKNEEINYIENYIENIENKKIKIIKNEKNYGPAYSRNKAVKSANFECLFFLDSDTEILKNGLNIFYKKIKKFDVVMGIYDIDPINKGFFPKYKAILDYHYLFKKFDYPHSTFHSACAGIRKELFLKIGGFNEKIKWKQDFENEELGDRLLMNNCKLYICPEIIVKHNFPVFPNIISIYFRRVASWIEFYLKEKKTFKMTGTTNLFAALGCLLIPLTIFFYFCNLFTNNYIILFSIISFISHVLIFFKFYKLLIIKNKINFFVYFIIHFFICTLISIASFYGFLKFFINKVRKNLSG